MNETLNKKEQSSENEIFLPNTEPNSLEFAIRNKTNGEYIFIQSDDEYIWDYEIYSKDYENTEGGVAEDIPDTMNAENTKEAVKIIIKELYPTTSLSDWEETDLEDFNENVKNVEKEKYEKYVANVQKKWEEHDNGVEQYRDEQESKEMNRLLETENNSWIQHHTALLMKRGIENNNAPFLPDNIGNINAQPIYDAATGYCVTANRLIPLQFAKSENEYKSNIVVNRETVTIFDNKIKENENGIFYSLKDENGEGIVKSYFFPEQTEKPDNIINSSKLNLYKPHNLEEYSIIITDSEPKLYLGAYLAGCKSGMKISVDPEIAEDFKKKITPILDNDIKIPEERNKNIIGLSELLYSAEKYGYEIINEQEKSIGTAYITDNENMFLGPIHMNNDEREQACFEIDLQFFNEELKKLSDNSTEEKTKIENKIMELQTEHEAYKDIQNIFNEEDSGMQVINTKVYHPENYGFDKDDKEHILIEYENNSDNKITEDGVFNWLQGNENLPDNWDINPITADKSGTIKEYLKKLESFNKSEIKKENKIDLSKVIAFDTETTGFKAGDDELLQVSITDGNGKELFNSYVKPEKKTEWKEAMEVNHITPEMVENSPTIKEIAPEIQKIFDNSDMYISFNGRYDVNFLETGGIKIKDKPHLDVMKASAKITKIPEKENDTRSIDGYHYPKLTELSETIGYKYKAHNSIEDTKATLKAAKYIYGKNLEKLSKDDLKKYTINKKTIENNKKEIVMEPSVPYEKNDETFRKMLNEQKQKENNKKYDTIKAEVSEFNEDKKIKKVNIKDIPGDIEDIYKSMKKEITPEKYTDRMFNIAKTIYRLPDYLNAASNNDLKTLKPLFKEFSKLPENATENQFRNVFNNYISKKENESTLFQMSRIYKKTLDKSFKGFKKKLDKYTENEMIENLNAIKNNTYPIQKAMDFVSFMYNPVNNAIWRGNNQIAAMRNNISNNYGTDTYIPETALLKQNPNMTFSYTLKSEIIPTGKDKNGQYTFQVLVPCHSAYKEEKDRRKLEYKKLVNEAKFQKKYGHLPVYQSQLQPIQQIPVLNQNQVTVPLTEPNKLPLTEENFPKIFQEDTKRLLISAFTKDPYVPSVDYTKEPAKQMLYNFALRNPEEIQKINNISYKQIADNVLEVEKQKQNTNNLEITSEQTKQNINTENKTNTNNHGRSR